MTAPTPEQMRALASELESEKDFMARLGYETDYKDAAVAALRAAADQLEAVQEALNGGSVATPAVVRVANARHALEYPGAVNHD